MPHSCCGKFNHDQPGPQALVVHFDGVEGTGDAPICLGA